ncbi:MAG: HD domain-containing protein [bacterium]|nr:HD domain-containing protein [bacterium]
MKNTREKVFRDPLYGNISIPYKSVLELIDTPEFQRLHRIRQLGMCFTVFHGAEHSRFQHCIGVMWLMHRILEHWKERRLIKLRRESAEAAVAAALLHDIGHGPFSHALENTFSVTDHETMGQLIVKERMSQVMRSNHVDPEEVLAILKGTHPEAVLHEILSSQLDADRMDYLQRDSLYTGAKYGLFDIDRIIYTLRPLYDKARNCHVCAIDPKGADAVESYLFSRYYMHWQVYLHKSVRAYEVQLRVILRRARAVYADNPGILYLPPNLRFLFEASPDAKVSPEFLRAYLGLDDFDFYHVIKLWAQGEDAILADLCQQFIERRPFKAFDHPGDGPVYERIKKYIKKIYGEKSAWYIHEDTSVNRGYGLYEPGAATTPIRVLDSCRDGWKEISQIARTRAIQALSDKIRRPLLLIPRNCAPHVSAWLGADKPYQEYLFDEL